MSILDTTLTLPTSAFCVPESTIIGDDLAPQSRIQNLFFGTGLCTAKQMSVGLPFDFMEFLYHS